MSGIILAHLRESPKDQPFKHFEEKNLWKTTREREPESLQDVLTFISLYERFRSHRFY